MNAVADTIIEALQGILEEQRQELRDIQRLTSQIASMRADVLLLTNAVRAITEEVNAA